MTVTTKKKKSPKFEAIIVNLRSKYRSETYMYLSCMISPSIMFKLRYFLSAQNRPLAYKTLASSAWLGMKFIPSINNVLTIVGILISVGRQISCSVYIEALCL